MSMAPAFIVAELRKATGLEWEYRTPSTGHYYAAPIPGTDETVCLSDACDSLWIWPTCSMWLHDDERAHLGASVARVLAEWAEVITRDASERIELAARLRKAAEGRHAA